MRYWVVILLGLGIDGMQALISLGLTGLGSAATAATFGLAGPVVLPLTTVIGFVVAITISATFGSGLLLVLAHNGMFYPKFAFSGGATELMPGIDIIPAWTLTAILSVAQKVKDEKKKELATASSTTQVRGEFGSTKQHFVQTRSRYNNSDEENGEEIPVQEQQAQPRQTFSNVRLVDGITAPRADLPAREPLTYAA